jgi:hypothetical protein
MRKSGIETTLTMRVDNSSAGDEKNPIYYPYYYVAKSVDAEGKVLEEEQFIGDAGFVIHFLDGLAAPAPDVRIPKTRVIDFESTIPAPLVVPTKSMLPADDSYADNFQPLVNIHSL